MNKNREGLYIVSHLIVTLVLVIGYVTLRILGQQDATLENVLLIIAGYWFGAVKNVDVKGAMNRNKKTG